MVVSMLVELVVGCARCCGCRTGCICVYVADGCWISVRHRVDEIAGAYRELIPTLDRLKDDIIVTEDPKVKQMGLSQKEALPFMALKALAGAKTFCCCGYYCVGGERFGTQLEPRTVCAALMRLSFSVSSPSRVETASTALRHGTVFGGA